MSHIIIDRRKNTKGKSVTNRRKFVRRVNQQVRDAVKDTIRKGSIKDIVDNKGKRIRIPGKGLSQPTFGHGKGGNHSNVHTGNKKFQQGKALYDSKVSYLNSDYFKRHIIRKKRVTIRSCI